MKEWANQRLRMLDGQPMSMQAVAAAASASRHKSERETNVLSSWVLATLPDPIVACCLAGSWSGRAGPLRMADEDENRKDMGTWDMGHGRLPRVGL